MAIHELEVDEVMHWLDRWSLRGAWKQLAFGVLFTIAMLAFVPATVFQLAAGAAFGFGRGLAIAFAASMAAVAIAFVIARRLARGPVERLAARYPGFAIAGDAITAGSWKLVALVRLSMLVPFAVSNYLFGLTRVGWWPYFLGSLAMLPATIVPVYLGTIGRSVIAGHDRTAVEWLALGGGALFTLAASLHLTRLAKRELAARSSTTDRR